MCWFSAWEGVVPWMYGGGLSVEGERCGVWASHSHVQICTCCKWWGRAVSISVWIEIHLHICVVGKWLVGVRCPTVRTRRIMDVVAGLQGPPEVTELPWLAKSWPGPSQPHQWQMAPFHTSWEEKVVTKPEQLSGACSQGVWGKRIPPERLSPVLDVGQCLSQGFRGVCKWSECSWSLQKLSVNRQELLLLWCLGR